MKTPTPKEAFKLLDQAITDDMPKSLRVAAGAFDVIEASHERLHDALRELLAISNVPDGYQGESVISEAVAALEAVR